jgi:hypothetical protein
MTHTSTITPLPTDTPPPTATNTPLPPPDEVKIRIEGVIENIGDSHWTVAGTRFELGSVMLINEERAQAQVGGWATVDAVKKPDGRIIARSIRVLRGPDEPPQDKEFRGVIESLGGGAWVIAGQRVLITSDTIIEGTPKVGAIARVKAKQYADGRLVAKGITVESEPEQQVVQFEGIIQAIDGDRWTVSGQDIFIDGQTQIEGTPAVGAIAEVEAVVRPDGTKVARSIKIESVVPPEPTATPTSEANPTEPAEDETTTPEGETPSPMPTQVSEEPTAAPTEGNGEVEEEETGLEEVEPEESVEEEPAKRSTVTFDIGTSSTIVDDMPTATCTPVAESAA